jgi:hypothetical protein
MASLLLTIGNGLAGLRTCVGTANAENKWADNVSATILEPSLSGID